MASVRLSHVSFCFVESVPLLSDVDLELGPGFAAVVGPNGAGKTTLLRLISGELRPEDGTVVVRPSDATLAHCPQEVATLDVTTRAFAASEDGRARALLHRLRLEPASLARWDTLSPGERKRWQIGAALAGEPDVLLLDEPTNHIDEEARSLLLAELAAFRGVGLLVSHDRAIIDALADTILRVEGGEVRMHPGPFAAAAATWARERSAARAAWELARDEERARKRALADLRTTHTAVDRQRSAGARMKSPRDRDARGVGADFRAARAEAHVGRAVARARDKLEGARRELPEKPETELGSEVFLGWAPAPQPILAVVEGAVTLRRDDRLRIVGPNGAGKSTLIRALASSTRARIGYLPQELSPDEMLGTVAAVRELDREAKGRVLSVVAALGVDPRRVLATERPSPGEARKLRLATLLGTHVHALLLDEPTNHLDLPSIERLERALEHYPGAIVLVTHDDAFAARCTDRIVRVADGAVV